MRKTLLTLMMAFALFVGISIYGNNLLEASFAQCSVTCTVVCINPGQGAGCDFNCEDCSVEECINKVGQCCEEAAANTPPEGFPLCPEGGGGGQQD